MNDLRQLLTLDINGRTVGAQQGDTILDAASRAGISIPTLCHVKGLTATGACRVCVVEVEGRDRPVTACSFAVSDGMKVQTHSSRVLDARRLLLQLILADHPDDCLYCTRSGSCDLQRIARELGIDRRRFGRTKRALPVDHSSVSVARDPDKCILCGKCVRTCGEIQTVAAIDFVQRGKQMVVATAWKPGLSDTGCVNCGQCVTACPTGALTEVSHVRAVLDVLRDPDKFVVVQHAPAVSVSLGEALGAKPGSDVDGQMVAALRQVGFRRVFDTSFSADLTIMEEASELVQRIQNNGRLPMFTSCSPGWIRFVEAFYPEFIGNLSTCKSPQQMLGAVIKTYFAERAGLEPGKIVSVSIMPCTAKKFEASRPEMGRDSVADVDYVLTTREAAQLLRQCGLEHLDLEPERADTPFGERTTAGKIFGASGGVMEAAIRTAHFLITGQELGSLTLEPLRGLNGAKELHTRVGGVEVGAAVVSGLGNARALLEQIKKGRSDLQFIEVMTCPGGCINGGGQPFAHDADAIRARMLALYALDESAPVRTSHSNASVRRLYSEFLGMPLSSTSHRLLHTHYERRALTL